VMHNPVPMKSLKVYITIRANIERTLVIEQ
jgi:hypothetical protein